jgi:hypothetical protein
VCVGVGVGLGVDVGVGVGVCVCACVCGGVGVWGCVCVCTCVCFCVCAQAILCLCLAKVLGYPQRLEVAKGSTLSAPDGRSCMRHWLPSPTVPLASTRGAEGTCARFVVFPRCICTEFLIACQAIQSALAELLGFAWARTIIGGAVHKPSTLKHKVMWPLKHM